MKNCDDDACCSEEDTTCHEKEDDCGAEFFLELADCAWAEVLKDKIKEHILSTQNDHMKELAKIVAESNSKKWKNKMEGKKDCDELEEKLCAFFSQHKK